MYLIGIRFRENNDVFKYSKKEYLFRTFLSFKIGMYFKDRRYSSKMEIFSIKEIDILTIGMHPEYMKYKTIELSCIEGEVYMNKNHTEYMEKRNIEISLEEAKKWYYSDNATLRTLALQAYTEKELEDLSFEDIKKELKIVDVFPRLDYTIKDHTAMYWLNDLRDDMKEFITLSLCAKYFNGDWKPEVGKDKYCLGIDTYFPNNAVIKIHNNIGVFKHTNILCNGVVYFKNAEDAVKAYEILNKKK